MSLISTIPPLDDESDIILELRNLIHFLELDGYTVDVDIVEFNEFWDLEAIIYVNAQIAGYAYRYDEIEHVIDRYFTEGGDN